jgi:acyl-CoA reductase-like NAD-dependent aldehyde dehydrogenase
MQQNREEHAGLTGNDRDGVFTHTIGGLDVRGAATFEVINPSTETVFAYSPDAGAPELDTAVRAARAAFPAWRAAGWEERGTCLRALATRMREKREQLARLITREQGKPFADARAEIERACINLEGYSVQNLAPKILREDERERIEEHFRPSGVAGVITAWNVPVNLFALRAGPILQSGSTVIVKPSPYTPLATLMIGELSSGLFPPGVLNVIAGQDALGQHLVEHPGIDRISFTGSVATGKRVMASAAPTLKRVSLELGGNDAAIVLDDVNVDEVADRLLKLSLQNCGQVCMAVKRIFVPNSLYDRFVARMAALAGQLRLGDGMAPDTDIGPLQNRMQYDLVCSLLKATQATPGARIAAGGNVPDRRGFFVEPTIVADLSDDAPLVQNEQFGPLVPVLRYQNIDEAVERANATRFGLGASVWSSDPARAAQVAALLEAGTVWVNTHTVLDPDVPFGGWKESGIGRGNGELGLQNCMESVVIRIVKAGV